jgi:ABC-2 type transport system permease protein
MSLLLGFLLEATIGMIGFWFLEVGSLLFVYMLISFFFSGLMFPIDMLPGGWQTLVKTVPLQYRAYFPAAIFQGKIEGTALIWRLWVQLAWVVFFLLAARTVFHFWVRHYTRVGGRRELADCGVRTRRGYTTLNLPRAAGRGLW